MSGILQGPLGLETGAASHTDPAAFPFHKGTASDQSETGQIHWTLEVSDADHQSLAGSLTCFMDFMHVAQGALPKVAETFLAVSSLVHWLRLCQLGCFRSETAWGQGFCWWLGSMVDDGSSLCA